MKKNLIILLIILSSIGFFFQKDISRITHSCYKANKIFLEVFQQENIDYKTQDLKVSSDSLIKINSNFPNKSTIPKISHHIYFNKNKKINVFFIEKMKANFNKINQLETGWNHYIWTNDPEIFQNEMMNVSGVSVKNINQLENNEFYYLLEQSLAKAEKSNFYFAEISDILRLILLKSFGGMYNDMDYEIYNAKALLKELNRFDFVGGREMEKDLSYYGNAFIASKPNHPILNNALNLLVRNHESKELPDYIKYHCREFDRIYFNGPVILTLSYLTKNNINGNIDVILPSWMIFNASFIRSKTDCDYNLMTKESFLEREKQIPNWLNEYIEKNKKNKFLPIIGADMFCGSWSKEAKKFKNKTH